MRSLSSSILTGGLICHNFFLSEGDNFLTLYFLTIWFLVIIQQKSSSVAIFDMIRGLTHNRRFSENIINIYLMQATYTVKISPSPPPPLFLIIPEFDVGELNVDVLLYSNQGFKFYRVHFYLFVFSVSNGRVSSLCSQPKHKFYVVVFLSQRTRLPALKRS